MPSKSLKPCSYPGCPNLTTGGRCPLHRKPDTRPTATERGYDAEWRRLRARHLRDNPYCVECAKFGKVEKATEVDHIIPHKGDDSLRLDPDNLQSLCHYHHSQKTGRERGRRTNTR
jgi:5-methylcytosine-specific restriction protein A